ncbi:hypothetical protein BGAL_0078g00230 [Botrytis galanthina]|uniref:Uncharacterized protein n=1 Tax=Botrytis galanthina TaxID=278940 RepID=A0A4S8RG30_9HELO|nr:hypothetical protein BGAL_0078g00230 [Botrytis galanthina]
MKLGAINRYGRIEPDVMEFLVLLALGIKKLKVHEVEAIIEIGRHVDCSWQRLQWISILSVNQYEAWHHTVVTRFGIGSSIPATMVRRAAHNIEGWEELMIRI